MKRKQQRPGDRVATEPLDEGLSTLGHERWRLLWQGTVALLEQEEPRAYRRLMAALERHGLAGPAIELRRDGDRRHYAERVAMATGTTDDLRALPAQLVAGVLHRVHAFAAAPGLGRLQGKRRRRTVSPAELLLAYQGARWKIRREAQAGQIRVRGAEALTELAHVLVGKHYGLTAETVRSFLQKARKAVPLPTRKVLALLEGEGAWALTLGASAPLSPRGDSRRKL